MSNKVGRPFGTFKNPVRKTHPIFCAWSAMKQRCHNPKAQNYAHYGGRGISICARWLGKEGFRNFYADMADSWQQGLTLERKNNSGNYEPSNCCWATWAEQAQNRRQCGKKNLNPNSLRQRAIRAGLKPILVQLRVNRGWDVERALSTPALPRGAQVGHPNYRKAKSLA